MRELFKGYYRLDDAELKQLWKSALFIFDTNILLNLYRYQSKTSDQLIQVMEMLKDRIWIPYHVGLEFQRKRISVIAEQHKRYNEVRGIVANNIKNLEKELDELQLKKRHSSINPDKLVDDVKQVTGKFNSDLDQLEKDSLQISSQDKMREKIDKLFLKKIGPAPTAQKDLDAIFKEGESRYEKEIPPGYKDKDKNTDCFSYGGFNYECKFGDLLIWKQIIDHARKHKLDNIIFVTDDNKSDWWLKIDSQGSKTISARPELIDEISREANVEKFHIYSTEKFLQYANEQIKAKVDVEAIDEVREVAIRRNLSAHNEFQEMAYAAERAVYEWLSSVHRKVIRNPNGFPDFEMYDGESKRGAEVKYTRDTRLLSHRISEIMLRTYHAVKEGLYSDVSLIIVVSELSDIDRFISQLERRRKELNIEMTVVIGVLEIMPNNRDICRFSPFRIL